MVEYSLPDIEQFAAFLDDNLSQSEMLQFSELSEHNGVLHELLDANSIVDNAIAGFTDADFQLPSELAGSDFELPEIPSEEISPLVTLTPEPMDDMLVAAAVCTEENPLMLSDESQEDSSYQVPDDNGDFDMPDSLLDEL